MFSGSLRASGLAHRRVTSSVIRAYATPARAGRPNIPGNGKPAKGKAKADGPNPVVPKPDAPKPAVKQQSDVPVGLEGFFGDPAVKSPKETKLEDKGKAKADEASWVVRLDRVPPAFIPVGGTTVLRLSRRPSADVAELVDALDLGSSAVRRGGSSPLIRTMGSRARDAFAL